MESLTAENRTSTGLRLTFGFSTLVIVLQLTLFLAIGAIAVYVSLYAYLNQVTVSQQQRSEELLRALHSAARSAHVSKDYATLSSDFVEIKEKSTSRPLDIIIDEIFVLSKEGSVLAHSDFTKVSPQSKSSIDSISSEYNNAFYHAAIQLQHGQTETRRLKTRQILNIEKSVRFLSAFFPWEMESALNYSTPLVSNDKLLGTVHLTVQNNLIQNAIRRILNEYSRFLLILAGGAILAAILFLTVFAYQLQLVRKIWEKYLARRIEQQRFNSQQQVIHTPAGHEPAPRQEGKPEKREKEKPIYDAILLDDSE
jgi:hypothetical protein